MTPFTTYLSSLMAVLTIELLKIAFMYREAKKMHKVRKELNASIHSMFDGIWDKEEQPTPKQEMN